MAIKMNFDVNNNVIQPTLVLMTRSGRKLGAMPVTNFQFRGVFNSASDGRFDVYKANVTKKIWNNLTDFKLVWAKEWNQVFEVICEIREEKGKLYKSCSMTSLGRSELSQINLYGIEINTEDDIARSDYEPTVIYNPFNANASLLDRISEKIPHYSFKHIDSRIASIQRTFSWDGTSIMDALNNVAEEVDAVVIVDCYMKDDSILTREISIYDLESYCEDCGTRGNFDNGVCEECGGTNVLPGYGQDTTIFISKDNLADSITLTTDDGSVKNCFKLVAGDDLMTATIANMNPNGSPYIWYLSDLVKSDMSDELVAKLEAYNRLYDQYQNTYRYSLSTSLMNAYNSLITKYQTYTQEYPTISSTITGYPALMQCYYEVVGFYYFLKHTLMPVVTQDATTASKETTNIQETFDETYSNIVSVRSASALTNLSVSTADSTVLQIAKTMVNQAYRVTISGTSTLSDKVWRGTIKVENYSDEEDTSTITLSLTFNSDYEAYVIQTLDRTLYSKNTDEVTDMTSLFRLSDTDFTEYLKKYSLANLQGIYDACQSCVDILIQQGIADGQTWSDTLYETLYTDGYYKRLGLIESELSLREQEISHIEDMMNGIVSLRDATQDSLDFEKYLGDLWLEFSAYRREDVYQNDNYISDGLSDSELFDNARQFLSVATKELYRSAELQHSISATVKNLLVMKEFKPIVEYFETGNWLRIKIDDNIYKLRLLEYEVLFDSPGTLNVTFSDVRKNFSAISDVKDVLDQARSIASSYDSVKRQAKQGSKSYDTQTGWVADGLALTNMQITNSAENQNIVWDDKGMLFREYDSVTDTYDDAQLKIINHGLYITDDNWETARAGIGKFNIWNPETQQTEEHYGVVADTVVGRLILGEKMYIANEGGNFKVDDKGITISNDYNQIKFNPNSTNRLLDIVKENNHIMYLDNEGNLNITGNITATSGSFTGTITSADGEIGGWKITSNALYSGTNSSTSTTAGLYLGTDAIRGYTDSTHYFTFSKGTINATGATISGTLTTGNLTATGGEIGGWKIASNAIYKGTNSATSTTAGLYLGNDAIRGYTDSTHYFTFSKGTINATGATISGALTATSGSIGGFQLDSNSIHTTNVAITTSSANSVGLSSSTFTRTINGSSRQNLKFAIGRNFGVGNDGQLYAGSAIISGTLTTDNLTATGGSIGGWTIGSSAIYNGTNSMTSTTSGTYIGTSGIRQYTSSARYVNISGGTLVAAGASISGSVTATSGKIGGWTVTSNQIYKEATVSGDTYRVRLYAPTSPSGTDVAIMVTGGTITQTDTSWHYYGDWGWYEWPNYKWFRLEKDDGSSMVVYENQSDYTLYKSIIDAGAETRGSHSSTFQSYTKILYNGTLDCVELYYTNMHSNSDRKLKEDITYIDINKSAELVYSLKPVSYRYKSNNSILHHGLIAQDVEESALYDTWDVVSESYEGNKTLNYVEMIADLIATVQQLNNRIKQLEEKG